MPKIIDLPGGFLVASDDDKPIRILKNADEVYEYLTGCKSSEIRYKVGENIHDLIDAAAKRNKISAIKALRTMCPGMYLIDAKTLVEAFFGYNPNTP